ncbi:MAG TPA: amylo-alpha-1,6-glucosidase [Candidatus Polarisedimenticolia bacterium]|nr:amylo-alpha-1,6-glucosidase [Candidatus Polarisedimenticolia bacterium]
MSTAFHPRAEWLEPDGLGGFASGTVSGVRTRRYHALLLAATTPPTGRLVLVNGFEAWVETPSGRFALTSHQYHPDVTHPDGAGRLAEFTTDPWPRWAYRLEDGTLIEHEVLVPKGIPCVAISWKVRGRPRHGVRLTVRPLISGRDYHSLHHENASFRFEPERMGNKLVWRPYEGLPPIVSTSNGTYTQDPLWFRNFLYEEERVRGLDAVEDLASPGVLGWDLEQGEAAWILGTTAGDAPAESSLKTIRTAEKRRRGRLSSPLEKAADQFFVNRGDGKTIVAGYPWFTDWGRDTFIALRGLCLATGRLAEARSILVEWASTVSEGMLPNVFPDGVATPEYNSVDASLWYVIAVSDFIRAVERTGRKVSAKDAAHLGEAVTAILEGYSRGTRYGIGLDEDGLLAAGVPGVQLTWMDAKIGDWVVTPRIGKPVEIQALWLNALAAGGAFSSRWKATFDRGLASFQSRFWNESGGILYDVVDVDHRPGAVDASFRPNQIFAVGGLPIPLIDDARGRRVVDAVEARLLTPMGLRSLAPSEPDYTGRYQGGPRERDAAYHRGTVWPWLLGPFVEAWVRVRGGTPAVRRQARDLFLAPLLRHLDQAGLGSISEIADADSPHAPQGCPWQAWSIGEALRMDRMILGDGKHES